jgi:hypothetical protein
LQAFVHPIASSVIGIFPIALKADDRNDVPLPSKLAGHLTINQQTIRKHKEKDVWEVSGYVQYLMAHQRLTPGKHYEGNTQLSSFGDNISQFCIIQLSLG